MTRTKIQKKVKSKLFCIDDEDENEIEEETTPQTAVTTPLSSEGLTYGYAEVRMVLDFPVNVQQAWFGTAEFFKSTRANLDKFVVFLKDLELLDAYAFYTKLNRMLRVLFIKSREEQGLKPLTIKHISRQAQEALNLICYRRYGEIFDMKEIINYIPRSSRYKKRPSRRRGACTTHSGACF